MIVLYLAISNLKFLGSGYGYAKWLVWADVVIFSLLVLVLVFQPAGLLGRLAPNKS